MSLLLAKSTQPAIVPPLVIPADTRRIVYRGVYRTEEYRTGSRFAFWQPAPVAAPPNDLTGSIALTFGGASVLRGAGALSGELPLTVGTSGAVTGVGALTASTALLFGTTGAVTDIPGKVSGTAGLVFGATGSLITLTPSTVTVATGGWYGARTPEQAARERKRRRDDEDKPSADLPSVAQAGPESAVATPQAPAADLDLVRNLVAYWTGEADRNELNRRAQRALDYALRAQTVLAMQLFERELARQMEEDEMSALLMILANDD